jgi:hypothetical protein
MLLLVPITFVATFAVTYMSTISTGHVAMDMGAALERALRHALIALPFALQLHSTPPTPYWANEQLMGMTLDVARFVTVCAICVAIVESVPRTPSVLSWAGLTAALPIYALHVLLFYPYSKLVGKARSTLTLPPPLPHLCSPTSHSPAAML